jgi:hypothetical protein
MKKQINITKVKEQSTSPKTDPIEKEVGSIPDK